VEVDGQNWKIEEEEEEETNRNLSGDPKF